jgi:hypothetical protein
VLTLVPALTQVHVTYIYFALLMYVYLLRVGVYNSVICYMEKWMNINMHDRTEVSAKSMPYKKSTT